MKTKTYPIAEGLVIQLHKLYFVRYSDAYAFA